MRPLRESALRMLGRGVRASFAAVALLVGGCAHGSGTNSGATREPGPDVARGATIFAAQCAACHGVEGIGGPAGASLAGERRKRTPRAIRTTIENPDPPMPKLYPGVLSARDLADVTAYVESL